MPLSDDSLYSDDQDDRESIVPDYISDRDIEADKLLDCSAGRTPNGHVVAQPVYGAIQQSSPKKVNGGIHQPSSPMKGNGDIRPSSPLKV